MVGLAALMTLSMDLSVKQALAKWPNVPAVYGWLSLDERGRWHIHEQGDATAGGRGDPITNPQILAFIGRNYAADELGRWYFQNGPQRVYVRLDAAPYVLRRADTSQGLITHTDVAVKTIAGWWLDDTGRLYAQTDVGGGLIDGRDLASILDQLRVMPGETALLEALGDENSPPDAIWQVNHAAYPGTVPLHNGATAKDIKQQLDFVANPVPE